MKVYDLIQELAQFGADQEVEIAVTAYCPDCTNKLNWLRGINYCTDCGQLLLQEVGEE